MDVTCFGSGSDGNSLLLRSGPTSVLIDAGIPVRQLRAGLRCSGIGDGELSAVLISHEHSDHIRSAARLAKYQPVSFFGTAGTIRELRGRLSVQWETIRDGAAFTVGDMTITPVTVPHDASEPVGFMIDDGDVRVALFTDLGEPNADVATAICGARLIVLESNYDETMLQNGPYPIHLKRRIRGPLGHLANDACARLLSETVSSDTTDIWLAHLSKNNNSPHAARWTTKAALSTTGNSPEITTLPRFGQIVTWNSDPASRPTQADLF